MHAEPIWLVANWKMHGTPARAMEFAYRVNQVMGAAPTCVNTVFCPPAILIGSAQAGLPQNARLAIGGQDCHAEPQGPHTGDIGAAMLREAGARFVIVGHSERRQQHGESDAQVYAKASAAITAGLTPIICIGETLQEYEAGMTAQVIAAQCESLKLLAAVSYLVAYEPVWAIGTGKTPTHREIEAAHACVKSALGSGVSVLYGGSVKPNNIRDILGVPGVSGALIGSASLDSDDMVVMLNSAVERVREG